MDSDNVIDLNSAREGRPTPQPSSFWERRQNDVSLMLAERVVQKIAPAQIMVTSMHAQFLRPWTMHATESNLWAVFALNQTDAPLSLGLDFRCDICRVEIGCSVQAYIQPVPIDNPWCVLHHLETVTQQDVAATLDKTAANYFYAFVAAYRQTLAVLANESVFYAEVKKRCLLKPELMQKQKRLTFTG